MKRQQSRNVAVGIVGCLTAALMVSCTPGVEPEKEEGATGTVLGNQLETAKWSLLQTSSESYPYGANERLQGSVNLASHGYVEEEYLVTGNARIYEAVPNSDYQVKVLGESEYTTRALVRQPENPDSWSGRVVIEYMNVTDGMDLQVAWARLHEQLLEEGDAYIAFTGKSNVLPVLKEFDGERYGTLSFGEPNALTGQTCGTSPGDADFNPNQVAGSENGLLWDMWNQIGLAAKSGDAPLPKGATTVIAYGESQSSIAMLNLHHWFGGDRAQTDKGETIFDGYLDEDSVGSVTLEGETTLRPLHLGILNQCADPLANEDPQMQLANQPNRGVPYFAVHSPWGMWPNVKTTAENFRDWTIAGAHHVDRNIYAHIYPVATDLERAGVLGADQLPWFNGATAETFSAAAWQCPAVPESALGAGVRTAYDWLLEWREKGEEPPVTDPVELDANNEIKLDSHGNVIGGVRFPTVEAPAATYVVGPYGDCSDLIVPFNQEKLSALYPQGDYQDKFAAAAQKAVDEGLLTEADAMTMIEQASSIKF